MKSLLLTLLALTLVQSAWAEVHINMERIAQIESSGDAMAYNRSSGARGLYQVTPICLTDFNRLNNAHYKPVEMHDPQKGARVAHWYMNTRISELLRHYGHQDTLRNRLIAYNAGVRALKRKILPLETRDYINKYNKGAK